MKFIISVLFSLILTFTAFSQSPSKLLKQAEKSLGGTKALQAIHSVSKTGKIPRVGDKATGRYTSRTIQPNLINTAIGNGHQPVGARPARQRHRPKSYHPGIRLSTI